MYYLNVDNKVKLSHLRDTYNIIKLHIIIFMIIIILLIKYKMIVNSKVFRIYFRWLLYEFHTIRVSRSRFHKYCEDTCVFFFTFFMKL